MSAHDKTTVGNGSMEWRTPYDLYMGLHLRYAFNYDAFAAHENTLCTTYSTVEGTFVKDACEEPVQIDACDALKQDWYRRRVFCNPPYSRGLIEPAVKKMADCRDEASIIVALLPASTDTRWFHDHIVGKATVHFLSKRVRFLRPDGTPGDSPPQGSMVVAWNPMWLP